MEMSNQFLCNEVHLEGAKLRATLASELFC
jgi:hypothetical protein